MEINSFNISAYPSSEKTYVEGKMFPIRVGMRKINLTPTVTFDKDNKKVFTPNAPVVVYDTSGPYTDPDIKTDINAGLPACASSGFSTAATWSNSTESRANMAASDLTTKASTA